MDNESGLDHGVTFATDSLTGNDSYQYPSWMTTLEPNRSYLPDNQSMSSVTQANTTSVAIQILFRIHIVANPLIAILGTIGNILAFFTFISKPLRRTSCSLYLAARSLSDTGFLLTLFVMWVGDATPFQLYHRNGICQTVIFLTYLCGFLSVWLVVLITVENYIRICHPFSVARFCTVPKARGFIIGLGLGGIILYNFPLWIAKVIEYPNGMRYCNFINKYVVITRALTYVDAVITFLIPSASIILLMVGITYSLITSLKRQKRLKQKSETTTAPQPKDKKRRGSSSPQAKVTKMLFAVSFIFLVLNLPSHAVRIRMVIMTYSKEPEEPTVDQMLQVIFQALYYLSFAVNLIVYLVCGDNFRRVFMDKYVSCLLHSKYMRRKSEVSHTSFTTIRVDPTEAVKEEETSLMS